MLQYSIVFDYQNANNLQDPPSADDLLISVIRNIKEDGICKHFLDLFCNGGGSIPEKFACFAVVWLSDLIPLPQKSIASRNAGDQELPFVRRLSLML